jgi:uncharacterized protein (UPF0332 family)
MKVKTVEDCFKLRLLRKIDPDHNKSKRSLEIANQRLKEINKAIKFEIYNFAILEAYMSIFHASRALLYKDGVQEKSHFAIYIYLKENYSKKIPVHILNLLNIHRTERHETMYGLDYTPTREDAIVARDDAKIFVKEVAKNLN